jgi:hypothetical protein
MKHFEDLVQGGEWDEVEKYLGGFTKVEDNRYSMKIFFEIRKQKYLEALDRCVKNFIAEQSFLIFFLFIILNLKYTNFFRHDRAKAVEILVKDLKVFASFNEELFKEITQLLTLENFRHCFLYTLFFLYVLNYDMIVLKEVCSFLLVNLEQAK